MRLLSAIPVRPFAWEEILGNLMQYPLELRKKAVGTAMTTGYATEGTLLTRMNSPEEKQLKAFGKALLNGEAVAPLPLENVLPHRIGPRVEQAIYAGKGKQYHLVLLRGSGRESIVEARAFLTLRNRHPQAAWYLPRGKKYWQRPLVLVKTGGFESGELVGMLRPPCFKNQEGFVLSQIPPEKTLQLSCKSGRYFYLKT